MKKVKKYGATKEEATILESAKCREIVNEILNFGVNQHQIKKLIKLLSLELEDRDLMLGIANLIDNEEESSVVEPKITI